MLGDPLDATNPMQWAKIALNFPGSPHYNTSLPWVRKVQEDGSRDGVDDLCPVGPSKEDTWQVSHRVATYYSYLGLHITSRKLSPPSQQPGPMGRDSCPHHF